MQTTINEYTGEFRTASYDNTIAFSTSSGQGQGDLPPEKTYKIGDYVWEDVDKENFINYLKEEFDKKVTELKILHLKDNVLPRGLVPLEELFDQNDVAKRTKLVPIVE